MCNPEENIFYVYVYLDPRKPGNYVYGEYEFGYEPFYVGKGCNGRAHSHLKRCYNKDFSNKIKEIGTPLIIFHTEHLNEYDAFVLEGKINRAVGRQNNNTGPLCNFVDTISGGMAGICHTDDAKQKMREAYKNRTDEIKLRIKQAASIYAKERILSEKSRQKISESNKGKHFASEETKQKMSESHKGIEVSEETKQKMSKSGKGRKHTTESKKKMSDRHKGKIISEEQRKHQSEIMKGRTHTEETKRKISESCRGCKNGMYGKKHNEETKKKMCEVHKNIGGYYE